MENTTATQTATDQAATDPGPAPAAIAAPRRPRFKLRRSPDDVMLSGLSAGIAEELDLDPALVRIAMAVLTVLTSGAMALVYIAGWILAPVEPARS
ncbi:PspC domain-containing protein [Pseudonocardia endophytica]|uniref:Phage shock protein C (PspC) family protein n=1 Tax=Pseudonocardia endophytica TaxID=401976 RepID=A0A4R1HH23_PSEEN|nr:PspC domain-containing protein [Pseudonocardia endophytica]TCK20073.1 phage shock protein C (PspC) family protein [Pseudonocardia endophytica]